MGFWILNHYPEDAWKNGLSKGRLSTAKDLMKREGNITKRWTVTRKQKYRRPLS